MVRGTGKFKQKRGGGRSFSKDMAFDTGDRTKHRSGEAGIEEDSDEEESEEEEESSEEESSEEEAKPELTRAERKALKKKQGTKEKAKAGGSKDDEEEDDDDDDDDDDLVNPNHVQKKMTIIGLETLLDSSPGVNGNEEKEKQEAKEKYWKLHQQGKTDQAKADLQRLAKIRAEREASQAKRKAEAEARASEADAKKAAQTAKRG